MTAIYSFQKPYRIWSGDRKSRKSVIASSLLELKLKGSEKLGYESIENVSSLKVVLESDGTEVEDDSYFQTAEKDTIFMLLKSNESWLPLGVDALKAALLTLPGIVGDSLAKLDASDRLPNWKISDHSGIVTVVLSWDTRDRIESCPSVSPTPNAPALLASAPLYLEQEIMECLGWSASPTPQQQGSAQPSTSAPVTTSAQAATSSTMASTTPAATASSATNTTQSPQQLLQQLQQQQLIQQQQLFHQQQLLSVPMQGRGRLSLEGLSSGLSPSPTPQSKLGFPIPTIQHQYVSFDSDSDEDMSDKDEESSPTHDHTHCDFHCSALHRQMMVKKSVATSPIVESVPFVPTTAAQASSSSFVPMSRISPTGKKTGSSGVPKYVRFQDTDESRAPKIVRMESSSSENTNPEEQTMVEKYLLLVDQPSLSSNNDNARRLTVKDIGLILEKLSYKILDVDRLEREQEGKDCFNWIIRALIKGDRMKEVAVIYNDNYYAIVEHPGYF